MNFCNKKYKFVTLALCIASILIISGVVKAADPPVPAEPKFDDTILGEASVQQSGFMFNFASFFGKLISLSANLVNWALNLNAAVLDSNVVKIGWTITRDFANLGFVLIILVLAFTTILSIKQYETKKILINLIIIALFINFSLLVAGVFIDVSGVLTNYFLGKASNTSEIATALTGALNAQNFIGVKMDPADQSLAGNIFNFGAKSINFFSNLLFVVIFTALAAFSLLGLAIMLLMRWIALTILLIVMPIAWISYIWPDTKKLWDQWWSEFIKWIWFAPTMAFFIYLALAMVDKNATNKISFDINIAAGSTFPLAAANASTSLGQMITVILILYGGLYVASISGVAVASVAQKFSGKAQAWGAGAAKWTGGYANRKIAGAGAGKDKPSWVQRVANNAAIIPGLKTVAGALNTYAQKPKTKIEEYTKQMSTWTPEMIRNRANLLGTGILNKEETAALAGKIGNLKYTTKDKNGNPIRKNIIDSLSEEQQNKFLIAAKSFGQEKDILKARPDLALDIESGWIKEHGMYFKTYKDDKGKDMVDPVTSEEMVNVFRRYIPKPNETADKLSPEALNTKGADGKVDAARKELVDTLTLSFADPHLTNIAANSPELQDKIQEIFNGLDAKIQGIKIDASATNGLTKEDFEKVIAQSQDTDTAMKNAIGTSFSKLSRIEMEGFKTLAKKFSSLDEIKNVIRVQEYRDTTAAWGGNPDNTRGRRAARLKQIKAQAQAQAQGSQPAPPAPPNP